MLLILSIDSLLSNISLINLLVNFAHCGVVGQSKALIFCSTEEGGKGGVGGWDGVHVVGVLGSFR